VARKKSQPEVAEVVEQEPSPVDPAPVRRRDRPQVDRRERFREQS